MTRQIGKQLKRSSIKIVRRKNVPSYKDFVTKMSQYQILNDLYNNRRKVDDPEQENRRKIRNELSIERLQKFHNMTNSDIFNELNKIAENRKAKIDVESYYLGKLSADDVIKKWAHKGIQSKSEVDRATAYLHPYELPYGSAEGASPLHYIDLEGTKRQRESGQVSFSSGMYSKYDKKMKEIAAEVKGNADLFKKKREDYLLGIALERPEYAAVISNILNGGSSMDNISTVRTRFNGSFGKPGTKASFMKKVFEYKLNRSRSPEMSLQRQKDIEESNRMFAERFNKKREEMVASHSKKQKGSEIEKDSDPRVTPFEDYRSQRFGAGKGEDDNGDLDLDIENRRKRRLKSSIKRKPLKPQKKIIKRKLVKKCRCK